MWNLHDKFMNLVDYGIMANNLLKFPYRSLFTLLRVIKRKVK
jgi:hypothetical protein